MFTSFENESPEFDEERMTYMVVQREKCPETGKLHWQGYAEMKRQFGMKMLKNIFGATTHLEGRLGSQGDAIAYCTKTDTRHSGPWYFGSPKRQGKRTDLEDMFTNIDNGSTIKSLAQGNPVLWSRAYKALHAYKQLVQKPRNWKTIVTCYWGATGTGKTRKAHEENPDAWFKPPGPWFDTYDGQKKVIWDDFEENEVSLSLFLRLTDRYPLLLPVKGAFVNWVPTELYITSNTNPREWYGGNPAVIRRLDNIVEFVAPHFFSPRLSPIVHTPLPIEIEQEWEQ